MSAAAYVSNRCEGFYTTKGNLACNAARRYGFHTCKRHANQEGDILEAIAFEEAEAAKRAALEATQRAAGVRIIICDGKTATDDTACEVFDVAMIKGKICYPGAPFVHYGYRQYDRWFGKYVLFLSNTPGGARAQAEGRMRYKEVMEARSSS